MERSRLQTVARFLKSQSTLTLSTAAAEGAPCAAPLFYLAAGGLRLYWLSDASSEHSRNLQRNPRAAVSVYRPVDDWKKIRGVQMRGTVSAVSEPAQREEIVGEYRRRFHLSPRLEPAILRSTLYCFAPDWVRYLDNSRRFGYRFELVPK